MRRLAPITDDDILEFLKQAQLVRESKFLQSTGKSKIDIQYNEKGEIKFSVEMPAREEIEVILIRLRPFIEYYERLHVGRIISYLLQKHGDSEFLRAYQLLLQPESEQQYPALVFNGKKYRMRDLLTVYMYGKYIHLDQEKQAISAAFEKSIGPLAEYFGLSQIDKYVGIVLGVAAYIRNNKLYESTL